MVRGILIPLLTVALLAAPATAQRGLGSTWAPQSDRLDERREQRDQENLRQQDREVPLSSILRDLRMQYGGQHLDARNAGGRYVISWITDDGRRLVIEVDARTGRTISVRG